MKAIHFIKMQGAGNDYVYIDGFREQIPAEAKPALARKLSDRHFGVGGDGLIFINPSAKADFEMEMYNADGSRGEMCGNGIRCVGKYVYDHRMAGREFTVESFGVVHALSVVDCNADGTAKTLRVNMGAPILEAARIPVQVPQEEAVDVPIEVDGRTWRMTCVSMGNPHAVVFVPDVGSLDLAAIGPQFEHHPVFPKRVNTEFVQVLSDHEVKMRVWERGAGETLACGTGCCAVATACVLNHRTREEILVDVLGGQLEIRWDRKENQIWMTGPAETVFEGVIGEEEVV